MQILKWIGLVVLILGGAVVVMALVGASLPVKHTSYAQRDAQSRAAAGVGCHLRATDLATRGDPL